MPFGGFASDAQRRPALQKGHIECSVMLQQSGEDNVQENDCNAVLQEYDKPLYGHDAVAIIRHFFLTV